MITFRLYKSEKRALLQIARDSILSNFKNGKRIDLDRYEISKLNKTAGGAFVSLHTKTGDLRGCIGRFDDTTPLHLLISEMAMACAFCDARFDPPQEKEMENLIIEISVLSPMRKIDRIEEIIPGRHGIYLKKGKLHGTFLPQVATKTKWTTEQLLGFCAKDKAKMGRDGWKSADIYIYEADIFTESIPSV